jgi:hypothetical protein
MQLVIDDCGTRGSGGDSGGGGGALQAVATRPGQTPCFSTTRGAAPVMLLPPVRRPALAPSVAVVVVPPLRRLLVRGAGARCRCPGFSRVRM